MRVSEVVVGQWRVPKPKSLPIPKPAKPKPRKLPDAANFKKNQAQATIQQAKAR